MLEVTNKEPHKESVALIGVNAKSGDVFHMGADSTGTSLLGKGDFEKNGDAVLEVGYTGGDGREGTLSIRHRFEDDDAHTLTLELPQPITVKMVRTKRR